MTDAEMIFAIVKIETAILIGLVTYWLGKDILW